MLHTLERKALQIGVACKESARQRPLGSKSAWGAKAHLKLLDDGRCTLQLRALEGEHRVAPLSFTEVVSDSSTSLEGR